MPPPYPQPLVLALQKQQPQPLRSQPGPPSVPPSVLAPLDPQSFTNPPPPLPYSYGTLLLIAFLISVTLLAVPFVVYWIFLRIHRWRRGRRTGGGPWSTDPNMREVESGCNRDGIDGTGDYACTGNTSGVVMVDNMRKVLFDGLKGVVSRMTVSMPQGYYGYATLPPLPPVQVKRIEVQRGRTLQEKRAGTQGLWRRESFTKRGELGDWKEVSEQGAWDIAYSGGVSQQKRAVSGPSMSGTVGSLHSTKKDTHSFLPERTTGSSLGSTASPLVQSICTVRKRCTGIPAGHAIFTAASKLSVEPLKIGEPTKSERPYWDQASWDGMLLKHSDNTKARISEVRGGASVREYSGQSLYEFVKKDGLNTAPANWCFHSRIPAKSGRQEEFLTCKIANSSVSDKEKEWQKDLHPQRQHWWKGWIKDRKDAQRDLAQPENLTRFGALGIDGTRIGSQRVSDGNGFVGLIPPAGTPIGRKREKTPHCIGTKAEEVEKGFKFFMRGARIQGNHSCVWLSKENIGDKLQCIGAVDDGNTLVGNAGPQQQDWCAVKPRGLGSDETGVNSENVDKLIAASWPSRENTNKTVGARIRVRPSLPYSAVLSSAAKTSSSLKRVPFTPLPPGINDSVCGHRFSIPAEKKADAISSPISIVAPQSVLTPLYGVTSSIRMRTAAHLPQPLPLDSVASNYIRNIHLSETPYTNPHLQFFTRRPLTTAIPYVASHPTRQSNLFEPQAKPYSSLLLPPLSRVLYEKWRKHSTPLYQDEPSAEEGLQLGQGYGGRKRDRWLRLRSASYEEGDGGGKLLAGGMKGKCSSPGVRRCAGMLWMYVIDLARKLEEGYSSHRLIMEDSDESILQRQVYLPEWFSPGRGCGDEEFYHLLHGDDTPAKTEDGDDSDVEFVLRFVARQMHKDIAELLRGFREEAFLSEVDSRLEWWWWQTRGSAAGICGREAERRREVLLQQEGRGTSTLVGMEKEYFDSHFKVELKEGAKWGQEWRWELDVPNDVRDAGAYCYPHPPHSTGEWYVETKSGSVQRITKYSKIERRQSGLGCRYNTDRIRRVRPSKQNMLEQAKSKVRGTEKMTWEKLREVVRKRLETSGDILMDVEVFANEPEVPMVPRKEQLRYVGRTGNSVDGSSEFSSPISSEQTTTHFETAVSSIVDDQICSDLGRSHGYLDGDTSTPGNSNTIGSSIERVSPRPLYALSLARANCGVHSMSPSNISRPRGKGMNVILQHRRGRCRAQSAFSEVEIGDSMLNGSGGRPHPLRSTTGSSKSSGSGYIAGDEDSSPLVALQLSSPSPASFNLTASTNTASSMCFEPENIILNFAAETSMQGVGKTGNFNSAKGEWNLNLCCLRDRTERGDKTSSVIGVYEFQSGSASESDEMELECVELEDEDSGDDGEKPEIDLIPEDVRGSWGRNGGYLGLDSMRAKVPGVSKYKRERQEFLDSEVSVQGLDPGWGSSSGPSQRQVPWFLSLRSLRIPETSSGTGGDSGREIRMLERMREFGRKVREVSGTNMTETATKGLGAAGSQEGVGTEIAGGAKIDREGNCEMDFWGVSIRKGVEGLFGPVKMPANVGIELYMEELD